MSAPLKPDRCLIVIFGASGDLTKRKLVPALYDLCRNRHLPKRCGVLGVSRTAMTDDEFRQRTKPWCEKDPAFSEDTWQHFAQRLHYQPADATDLTSFKQQLVPRLGALCKEHQTGDNVLYYLSVAPGLYDPIVMNIGASGLVTEGKRWCSINRDALPWQRVVVEKPFGHDLDSAEHLNRVLGRVFDEESVYNIDHYLGKETVQNLLVFRFANAIFEPLWNRNYIDHVQITAAETVGVEDRGAFYEKAGAMRDMIQSHLLQVLAVLTMDTPNSSRAHDLRVEQRKLLEAIRVIDEAQAPLFAVRGQYGAGEVNGEPLAAYRDDPNTAADSQTETYTAMKLLIDNWRWHGVPFFLRTGKAMRRKLTQIVVTFRPAPHPIFANMCGDEAPQPNRLVINVQPDEGINLRFIGKVPGQGTDLRNAVMDFDYAQFGGEVQEAYAHLLLDAMCGDRSLFKDRFEIEAAWRIVMPVLNYWNNHPAADLPNYAAGSWGPAEADELIAPHGPWRNPEGEVSRSKYLQR